MKLCLYGTYQRALSAAGLPVRVAAANPRAFVRALAGRLKSVRNPAQREARKLYYREGFQHLRADLETMNHFRF